MTWTRHGALCLLLTVSAHGAELKGIEYSHPGQNRLRMDGHLPSGAGPFPVAILVHGGAWVAGSPGFDVRPLFRPLSDAGFAWFTIHYRMARNRPFKGSIIDASKIRDGIEDVQSAVNFVRSHATEFHVDPNRIVLIGASSGAHLASMAAIRGAPVKAVVAFYCPSDLVSMAFPSGAFHQIVARATWGSPAQSEFLELSPILQAHPGMPPFLFIHGTADHIVPFEQSTKMCDQIRRTGSSCDLMPVPGGLHGMQLWEALRKTAYKEQMTAWLTAHLN
ncbi:MAG: alpha/beta fold hydrolase [Bryobacteraceae bacterium]